MGEGVGVVVGRPFIKKLFFKRNNIQNIKMLPIILVWSRILIYVSHVNSDVILQKFGASLFFKKKVTHRPLLPRR